MLRRYARYIVALGVFSAPDAQATSPNIECGVRTRNWCAPSYFDVKRHDSESGFIEWKIYQQSWINYPLVILEKNSCENSSPDIADVTRDEDQYEYEGLRWHRLSIRIHSSGDCDIVFLTPQINSNLADSAMGEIRICFDSICASDSVGEILNKKQ